MRIKSLEEQLELARAAKPLAVERSWAGRMEICLWRIKVVSLSVCSKHTCLAHEPGR